MELFVTVDPAQLPRLRAQSIIKSCRLGRSKSWVEQGEVAASAESPAFSYRAALTRTPLGGSKWRAEMTTETVDIASGDKLHQYCRVGFCLVEGISAPLANLLQALAERVPLWLAPAPRWAGAFELLREAPSAPSKGKPPSMAPDISNAGALRAIAGANLAHLLANLQCLVATGDPEAIHQMRVALRRLRSAMTLFKAMLHDPHSHGLRSELRWMQQVLGAARDKDVLIAEILQPVDRLFHTAPGYLELCDQIEASRQADRAAMLAEVKSPRFAKGLLRLACWLEEIGQGDRLGQEPVRTLALATLNRRHRRVKKRMAHFHSLDETGRHECRIEIKKLRYAIDFFGGILSDRRAAKMASQLALLQDALGHLNDIAAAGRHLQQIAKQAPGQDVAWAAGMVAGWHRNRTDELLDQAWNLWHEVEKLPLFWKEGEN
jgi:triphosphatase